MASQSDADSFTQYPLHLDPTTKAITLSSTTGFESQRQTDQINAELKALNLLHRSLINLDPPTIPPPPLPINPKRSAQITKLRDTANTAYRKNNIQEAVKLYGLAIEMAFSRPPWEPLGVVRDELSGLYANRAQAYMSTQSWPEGWVDAKCSVECKPVGNPKGWWRGGKCLLEMGRKDEARAWIERAIEVEGKTGEGGKELTSLLEELNAGERK